MIKNVTLTLDNGPNPGVTERVLEVLQRRKILATFFVIGQNVAAPGGRALAERAAREGHWIGNHTFTHSIQLGDSLDPGAPEAEIGRTQELIEDIAGPRRLFRPFGGGGFRGPQLLSERALSYLVDGKFTCILWNAVPRDWENPDSWVEVALAQCRDNDWTTIVVHDLPTGAMRHLDTFIGRALDEGASFQQEFSPDCVVIDRGDVVADMTGFVSKDRV